MITKCSHFQLNSMKLRNFILIDSFEIFFKFKNIEQNEKFNH